MTRALPGVIGLVLAVVASEGLAATTLHYWTGASATSGNWTTPANWLGNGAPTGGDQRLIFDSDAWRKLNTNNFPAGTTFESIWLLDDGYNIYGNSVRTALLRMDDTSGTSTFRPDIIAPGNLTITVELSTGTLIVAGDISLSGDNLTTSGAGDITLQGVISGTGNLFKNNGGDLRLSGFGPNTFSGTTTVNAGILRLNRFNLGPEFTFPGTTAIPGDLIIGSGLGGLIGDAVALENDHQIANTSDVTVFGSGELNLGGNNDTIGSLTMTAGHVTTGAGILTLGGNVRCNLGNNQSIVSGRLGLGSGTARHFDVVQGAEMYLNAIVSGGPGISLIKTNRGELFLNATNTYSGATHVLGGTLTLMKSQALGDTVGDTILQGGALKISHPNGLGIAAETLIVEGASILTVEDGAGAWNGPVELNATLTVSSSAPLSIAFTDVISGPGGFTKIGDGMMTLKGPAPNTHTGTNRVNAGTLEIYKFLNQQDVVSIPGPIVVGDGIGAAGSVILRYGGHGQLADHVPLTVREDGIVYLQGWRETIGSLSGSGEVVLGNSPLLVGANNVDSIFDGVFSGAGSLVKTGLAALTLTGVSTFTGDTRVSGGALLVNGELSASPTVEVQAGTTLGGTGVVQAIAVNSGGRLSPGNSPGLLRAEGGVIFAGGVFAVELNGATAGSGHDQLRGDEDVTVSGASLQISLGFVLPTGTSMTILNKTSAGPVTGTFAGLSEGEVFAAGGLPFEISYTGGDGNDVVLTRVSAPASNISKIEALKDGTYQIQGVGLTGLEYTLEASTTLLPGSWTVIDTDIADRAGIYVLIDKDAPLYPTRFYRVISP